MHRQSYQEPIEIFYMNALPFPVRDAAVSLLKTYMLDELMRMRLDQVDPELAEQFQLNPEQWENALNMVVLTKLTYFNIHPQLPKSYLQKLVKIAAFALDKPKHNVQQLLDEIDPDATILCEWLNNIKSALPRAK